MTCQPVQQFSSLFHNGKVGAKIGVEDIIKSQPAQCSDQFARNERTGINTEFFPKGSPDSRGCLHHYCFIRIIQCPDYITGMVNLSQGTGRADGNTLAAVGAG